uniref:serine/arginine repetitive matrix protein 1-like n=1 Tax=Erigeron canadensis TaxID=72917 RepID=UPI001CB89968|nr:serine/arginine repetitive matrix protein 1-like [Erigeron canadensis]
MEEDGEETPRTPFWIQSTTNVRRVDLYRRRASSLFFNSGVLIIFLLIVAILSMLVIIPRLIAFSSHIFKPNLVKKSWDSINLVLVLFALAFGFLSRNINKDDNHRDNNKLRFSENRFGRSRSDLSSGTPVTNPAISTPHQYYDFPEQPIVGLRRHRSTSSYPDLRELSPPWNHRRFSDDTHFNYDRYYFRREHDLEDIKDVVHVDTVVGLPQEASFAPVPAPEPVKVESHSPAPLPPSPPPPPPMPSAPTRGSKEKPIRTYQSVEKVSSLEVNKISLPEKETDLLENHDSEIKEQTFVRKRGKGQRRRARSTEPRKMVSPVSEPEPEPEPEPSSPPEIMPEIQELEPKTGKVERKRTGNATKEFFTSFYLKKKKKRQRQRSVDNLDTLVHPSKPPVKINSPAPPPPPPPPPPPAPSSLLNNLFTSKKERRKKNSSEKPPQPSTAARVQTTTITAARAPRPTTTRVSPFVTEKPRAPVKMTFFSGIDDSSSGGESPMSRIPPPPPMPPFKMADWKFPVEGDYVRVQSTLSSGSMSPDGDESQSPSSAVASPLFCPSPDVDTKADTFIARFRAGLKLEKMHSFNQSQGNRMSNLGPGPSQSNRF